MGMERLIEILAKKADIDTFAYEFLQIPRKDEKSINGIIRASKIEDDRDGEWVYGRGLDEFNRLTRIIRSLPEGIQKWMPIKEGWFIGIDKKRMDEKDINNDFMLLYLIQINWINEFNMPIRGGITASKDGWWNFYNYRLQYFREGKDNKPGFYLAPSFLNDLVNKPYLPSRTKLFVEYIEKEFSGAFAVVDNEHKEGTAIWPYVPVLSMNTEGITKAVTEINMIMQKYITLFEGQKKIQTEYKKKQEDLATEREKAQDDLFRLNL